MTTTMDHVSPPPAPGAAQPAETAGEPQKAAEPAQEGAKKPLSSVKSVALIAGAGLLAFSAAAYWYYGTFFEDTDDAQVDGYISNVASRVGGTVTAVRVDDNQSVNPNQVLVELDPTDLRVARDGAKAALAQAQAELRAEQSNASVTETSNQTLVVPQEQGNQVAGLINLSRNMGGDVGIALVTTLLARRAQHHQVDLVAHASLFDAPFRLRLEGITQAVQHAGASATEAANEATRALYRSVLQQAQTLAYVDVLYLSAWGTALMVPLSFLMKKPRPGGAAPGH